jgi:hypothetical protein
MKPEENKFDSLLRSEPQQAIREVVKRLPEDSLSLAWRSSLNERLHAIRPVSVWRSFLSRSWRPAFGLALSGCLAILVTLRHTEPPAPVHHSIEASLVQAYDDSTRVDDLVGPGLSSHEVGDTTRDLDSSSDWSESDLGAL